MSAGQLESDVDLAVLRGGIPLEPLPDFDPDAKLDPSVPHAPARLHRLEPHEMKALHFWTE